MSLPEASLIRSLALPGLGSGDDERIDRMLTAADAVLAQLCYYPRPASGGPPTLEVADYVEYYSRVDPDPRRLTLGLRPVGELAGVAFDEAGDLGYTSLADLDADLVLDDRRGVLLLHPSSTWTWGDSLRGIRVSCSAGYDVSAEPPLVEALALLVGHWVAVGQAGTLLQTASANGSSVSFRDLGLPPAVRALLSPYILFERETGLRGQP